MRAYHSVGNIVGPRMVVGGCFEVLKAVEKGTTMIGKKCPYGSFITVHVEMLQNFPGSEDTCVQYVMTSTQPPLRVHVN